jgi:hypothetical protein
MDILRFAAIILAYFWAFHLNFGVIGVWVAMCLDEFMRLIIILHRWFSKKWEKKGVVSTTTISNYHRGLKRLQCMLKKEINRRNGRTRQQAAMQMIADGSSERITKLMGGWKTDAAFNRYIDDQTIYDIQTGALQFDKTWYESMKPKAVTYYAGQDT